MLKLKLLKSCIVALLFFVQLPLAAQNFLLECKGAYFRPTNERFKNIFGKGAGLFNAELTFDIGENECWYGFASVGYMSKVGRSIGLDTPTKVQIVPLAVGLKCLAPFDYGNWYVGIGFQPTHLHTSNDSPFVANTSKWGLGGITKLGVFFDMSCNFFIDVFFDYSFVKIGQEKDLQAPAGAVVPLKATISGAIFGAGLGYRF